jgi:hypothetical protein
MTNAIVAVAADVTEACAHAVAAILTVFGAITCVKTRDDRTVVSIRRADWTDRVALAVLHLCAATLTGTAGEVWGALTASDVSGTLVARRCRDVVMHASGTAAVATQSVAVVTLLIRADDTVAAPLATNPTLITGGP